MIKSIFLVDRNGEIQIEKNYVGITPQKDIEPALNLIKNGAKIPPILESFGSVFLIHKENELFFVGVIEQNESTIAFASEYIVHIAKTISSLIRGGLTNETLKTGYPMIYKVLDQSIDEGFPFLDEASALVASFSGIIDSNISVDRRYPWRGTCEIHGAPQFTINVIESIDLHVSETGKIELNEVRGSVNVFCKVPGDPVVSLTTVMPNKFTELCYHRCVDAKLHLSRRIQFIPSDGNFCLLKYVAPPDYKQVPLFVTPKFSWSNVSVVFEISLRVNQTLPQKLTNVNISFVLPKGVCAPSLASPRGTTNYNKETNTVEWSIDNTGRGSLPLILNGSASVNNLEEARADTVYVKAQFSATGYAASGLKIDNFDIESNCKNITKEINYTTKGGVYDFAVSK